MPPCSTNDSGLNGIRKITWGQNGQPLEEKRGSVLMKKKEDDSSLCHN